jgi:hypothetical protein
MKRLLYLIVIIAFTINCVLPPSVMSQTLSGVTIMPEPGAMAELSSSFIPAHLVGMTIDIQDALKFDFIIHKGDLPLTEEQKPEEYRQLVKYFLAALTIPDEDQWVNLSPYEGSRILKDDFGMTEMGRDLLAQDYLLKQLTASLMHPDSDIGKKFWARIYEQTWEKYGTTDIPVDTFNKIWITPDKAVVYEKGNSALVVESRLKVMTERDYLSLDTNALIRESGPVPVVTETTEISSMIVKEVIVPEIEREVNEGKNFANLRQIYSAMVLATWYKKALKESLLGKIYADQAKVKGVDQDPKNNETIYQNYIKAFQKGVFNFIKEDYDRYAEEMIPRKYFSGGFAPKPGYVKPVQSIPQPQAQRFQDAAQKQEFDSAMISLSPQNAKLPQVLQTEIQRPNDIGTLGPLARPSKEGETAPSKAITIPQGAKINVTAIDLDFGIVPTEKGFTITWVNPVTQERYSQEYPQETTVAVGRSANKEGGKIVPEITETSFRMPPPPGPLANFTSRDHFKFIRLANGPNGQFVFNDTSRNGGTSVGISIPVSPEKPSFIYLGENRYQAKMSPSGSLVIDWVPQDGTIAGSAEVKLGQPGAIPGTDENATVTLRKMNDQFYADFTSRVPITMAQSDRAMTGFAMASPSREQVTAALGLAKGFGSDFAKQDIFKALVQAGKMNEAKSMLLSDNTAYQNFQLEPTTALYPGGLDLTIFRLFPNLVEVHYYNKNPFQVPTYVDELVFRGATGTTALQKMKAAYREQSQSHFINNELQEEILYSNKDRPGVPQIGMRLLILDDLEQSGAVDIKETKTSDKTYEISFVDAFGDAKKMVYHEGTLSPSSEIKEEGDLLFLKAWDPGPSVLPKKIFETAKYIVWEGPIVMTPNGIQNDTFDNNPDLKKYFDENLAPEETVLGGTGTVWEKLGYSADGLQVARNKNSKPAKERFSGGPQIAPVRAVPLKPDVDFAAKTVDNAATRGGIDLNAAQLDMQIKRDGNGVPLPVSQQNLENIKIDGMVPQVLNIRPVTSLPMLSEAAMASDSSSV